MLTKDKLLLLKGSAEMASTQHSDIATITEGYGVKRVLRRAPKLTTTSLPRWRSDGRMRE